MSLLTVTEANQIATVTLNRPEVHNAFNAELIQEATHLFHELAKKDLRLVILTGAGQSFCAGADLNWMSSMVKYTEEENFQDAKKLAQLYRELNYLPFPLIGKVNGHALGGGSGIVACCDYVVASSKALFGFTEARLGLIPSVISPFVIAKIGESQARAWFLSGERFSAEQAKSMNLIHEVVEPEKLDDSIELVKKRFLLAGPQAAREAKKLVARVVQRSEAYEVLENDTCRRIAKLRVSPEGQDGMQALLNKSKPKWVAP